jgi:hypothetical protein
VIARLRRWRAAWWYSGRGGDPVAMELAILQERAAARPHVPGRTSWQAQGHAVNGTGCEIEWKRSTRTWTVYLRPVNPGNVTVAAEHRRLTKACTQALDAWHHPKLPLPGYPR